MYGWNSRLTATRREPKRQFIHVAQGIRPQTAGIRPNPPRDVNQSHISFTSRRKVRADISLPALQLQLGCLRQGVAVEDRVLAGALLLAVVVEEAEGVFAQADNGVEVAGGK